MTLTAFTGTTSITTLRSNFDDATIALTTASLVGQKDQTRHLYVASLAVATALSARTVAWTQFDDAAVQDMFVRVTDGAVAATVTGTLTQDEDATEFLIDNTVSISVAAINGTIDSRTASATDYRTTTGPRFRLKKGVRYRLTLSTTVATVDIAMVVLQLRSYRRIA